MGLPVSRQAFEDRETEQRWLLKEARIRHAPLRYLYPQIDMLMLPQDYDIYNSTGSRLSLLSQPSLPLKYVRTRI
jgi:hypothetical protein